MMDEKDIYEINENEKSKLHVAVVAINSSLYIHHYRNVCINLKVESINHTL